VSTFGEGDRVRLQGAGADRSKTGTVVMVALGYNHGHPTRYAVRWEDGSTRRGYRAQELESAR
jgi:hypothetical protein